MQDTQLKPPRLTIPDSQRGAAIIRHAARSGSTQMIAAAHLLTDHRGGALLHDGSPLAGFLNQQTDPDVLACDWPALYDSLPPGGPADGQPIQDWAVQVFACALAIGRAVHRLGWLFAQLEEDTFRTITRACYTARAGIPPASGWPAPSGGQVPLFEEVAARFPNADEPPE